MNQRGFRGGKGPALYPTGSIYPNVKNEKGKGGRVHGIPRRKASSESPV